ncbi:AsnC family transcriptional regulator [Paractinoplanes deccanensis]|uniref:AsnC family transcriptional regulator n=1 Tax=Paractinoplanes deccanensis TaxID=113561 RepID=A0ABQ3YKY1_9ACTN|nr:AsnC family transcriptional regulator [Actinoplanes deccanensis]GID80648.1 AsnC family transcriptional regulator [Actinoplanes deccanensis]
MATESRVPDHIDRQILHALHLSPRAPFARIAAVIGVSEQTVARRYQRMRGSGIVRVLARPDPSHMPGATYWTLRIGCRPGTAPALADALARRGDTAWISIGAGGAEITCSAVVTENHAGLLHHLPRASNVLTFSAHQILHRFAGRGEVDWVATGHELDTDQQAALLEGHTEPPRSDALIEAADQPLLDALARDGRASWASLAEATGWTQRQAAQRVAALTGSRALYFDLDVADTAIGIQASANLWFTIAPAHLAEVGARLADHPQLSFAAAVTGSANLMAAARCRDAAALYRYLTTEVAAIEGIQNVETVPQLTRVKQAHFLIENGMVRDPYP